jgi:hypothetical protein
MLVDEQMVIANVPYNDRLDTIERFICVFGGVSYAAKAITMYPGYLRDGAEKSCDLAVIELTEDVKEITPAHLSVRFDELHSNVVGVGYGAFGMASKSGGGLITDGRKIAGENVIDSITGYRIHGRQTLMLCDFDHPTDKQLNVMGSPVPRPLEYIGTGGDSGGGLFRKKDGGWELVGIFSNTTYDMKRFSTSGYYGQVMGWTRVSTARSWIKKQAPGMR